MLSTKSISKLCQYQAGYRHGVKHNDLTNNSFLPFYVYRQGQSFMNGFKAAVLPLTTVYTLGV